MSTDAENLLKMVRAAEARGDLDAANAHWRDFVRALWRTMAARVPWDAPQKSNEGRE